MRKREMSFVYDADKMAEVHHDEHNFLLWIKAEEALRDVGIEIITSSDKPYLKEDEDIEGKNTFKKAEHLIKYYR